MAKKQIIERVPPQNIEAEKSVLGSCLIDPEALEKILEIVNSPDLFYRESHRNIFKNIVDLSERGEPVDLVTLTEQLKKRNEYDKVGGAEALTDLISVLPLTANAEFYSVIIREKALLRALIHAGAEISEMGFKEEEDVGELLDKAEQTIFKLTSRERRDEVMHIKPILEETMDRINELLKKKESITGIPSGFDDLNRITAGFQPGDLIIIAARPSIGKSSLGLNIAQNAAIKHRLPVLIFSLEMSRQSLGQRLLCAEARVDSSRLRTGHLSESDFPGLIEATNRLTNAPIYIDDSSPINVLEIRAKARRLKNKAGLALMIVDYLQLISPSRRADNRAVEVSEISRSLKGLAKELDIPIIAMSQLSRRVEERQDKMPQLSDLRESGAIEQDADIVAFIHREFKADIAADVGTDAEIIVAKQRNGPTGSVKLTFLKNLTRFENYYGEEDYE